MYVMPSHATPHNNLCLFVLAHRKRVGELLILLFLRKIMWGKVQTLHMHWFEKVMQSIMQHLALMS